MTTSGEALFDLQTIASEIGATEIGEDVHALAARVAQGLFYVACIGQFKRGKSTLINALVGMPLLPTGVVPVTAVITMIRYGEAVRTVVRFDDSREQVIDPAEVAEYVTEERNPENRKHVRALELFAPSDLLASGMCLVDTPGLGSMSQQSTETTRAFLPHIDAALVVLGADPPISGEEAAILDQIAPEVRHILFVLNKADRLSDGDVAEAVAFTRDALQQRLGREVELFTVSALERLQGSTTREWPALEAALTALARDAGADLVRAAQQRGEMRLAQSLLREIDEQHGALVRPVEASEARVTALRRTIDDARRALIDLGYLFTAEQDRLSREFEEERNRFLSETLDRAIAELDAAMSQFHRTYGIREHAYESAESIAQKCVGEWLEKIERRAEELYSAAMDRFVSLTQDFLRRIDSHEANEAADEVAAEQRFRKRRQFFFTGLWMLTGRPPGAAIVDLLRTAAQKRDRALRDAHSYLRRLFESNSARVANDLRERVLESRRSLEGEIRRILDRATRSAERALKLARTSHDAGASAVERELGRLAEARERLQRAVSLSDGSSPPYWPAPPPS